MSKELKKQQLKELIKHYAQDNQAEFARMLGISPQAVSTWLTRGSFDTELIYSKCEDVSADWLLSGSGDMLRHANTQLAEIELANKFSLRSDNDIEMQRIPLYDIEATAGIVSLFTDTFSQEPESYLSIPDIPPCDGAIRVVGNSMDPIIRGGDIVLFKKIHNMDWGVAWGEMHIISFGIDGDEYIMVKYLKKGRNDKTVILASENPAYDPMEIPIASIRALAIVKASVRYNTMR